MEQKVAVLNTRVDNLERRFDDHERRQNGSMERIDKHLEAIDAKIDGRPSWGVALLLSGLLSLVVGLTVALTSRG